MRGGLHEQICPMAPQSLYIGVSRPRIRGKDVGWVAQQKTLGLYKARFSSPDAAAAWLAGQMGWPKESLRHASINIISVAGMSTCHFNFTGVFSRLMCVVLVSDFSSSSIVGWHVYQAVCRHSCTEGQGEGPSGCALHNDIGGLLFEGRPWVGTLLRSLQRVRFLGPACIYEGGREVLHNACIMHPSGRQVAVAKMAQRLTQLSGRADTIQWHVARCVCTHHTSCQVARHLKINPKTLLKKQVGNSLARRRFQAALKVFARYSAADLESLESEEQKCRQIFAKEPNKRVQVRNSLQIYCELF